MNDYFLFSLMGLGLGVSIGMMLCGATRKTKLEEDVDELKTTIKDHERRLTKVEQK